MESAARVANGASNAGFADTAKSLDLSFLPMNLTAQCRSLIESYHELHGYSSLPNILWKSRLGQFIEAHREFRQLLRRASRTRSAKKSNEGFVLIATTILSLEILASSFAGWSAIYPEAGAKAQAILQRSARSPHMPLMEYYLYPPKYVSSAAIAALAPPLNRRAGEMEAYRASATDASTEKWDLTHVSVVHKTVHGRSAGAAAAGSPV